jgi:serine/threonine protein kinase/WD40 repeat protein
MSVPTDPCGVDHPELARLIEQVTETLEAGDPVDVEALLQEYPQHAEQIQSLLPAMTALMELSTPPARRTTLPMPDESGDTRKPRTLGDFRIGREIGRGGMGIVYEAEQISMHRRVALKVLPLAGLVDERRIRRFQNEVRAVAALNHPHIVPVYLVGEERGVHFYAMQLIRGRSLSDVLLSLRHERADPKKLRTDFTRKSSYSRAPDGVEAGFNPSTEVIACAHAEDSDETVAPVDGSTIPHSTHREYFRNVAELGIQAATALQHAHDEGIIHRDVKPANFLLDKSSQLYLTDFGLARIESDVGMTMTGDLIGTLRYMAPEQALAKRVVVDHRADIYSLAATLYELLTLQPAYLAEDRQQLLKQIAFEDPTPPRRIDKEIPIELETIILKAMSKDMDDRYSSAEEFGDDLQSYLENRPIKAKPPTVTQSIGKWIRRNPVVFSAAVTIGLVLIVATTLSSILAVQAIQAKQEVANSAAVNRRLSYLSGIHLAHQIFKDSGDLARASQWLTQSLPAAGEEDLRGFEWYYLWNVCRTDHSVRVLPRVGLVEVAFSPDNLTFATGGSDGMVQIWDRHTRQKIGSPWPVDPEPNSQYRSIDVLYSPSGELVAGLFRDGFFQVQGRVVLFNVNSGDSYSLAHPSPNNVIQIAFKQDGTLTTAERDGHVRFWNASTGTPLGNAKQLAADVEWRRAAFSSDLQLLAAGQAHGEKAKVTVYRLASSAVESELEAKGCTLGKLHFTRDSRFLINPGNPPFGEAKLVVWDVDTGEVIFSPEERNGLRCYSGVASISADVIAVGGSNSISFVNPSRQEMVDHWRGIPGVVADLAVSPDGQQLASTGWDGMVRFWDLPRQENPMIHQLMDTTAELSFSPSNDILACTHTTGVVLRHSLTFQELRRLNGEKRPVFSPAGNLLGTISVDESTIRFWDYFSGEQVGSPLTFDDQTLSQLAFSTDGKRLGCATRNGPVITLELANPSKRRQFNVRPSVMNLYRYVAFGVSRDGQDLIAIPASERTVKLVNLHNGEEKVLSGPTTQIYGVVFSPDSRRIVSYGNDIFAWDTDTGETELGIPENTGATLQVAFSPDGASILTRGFKYNVGLWDLQSGREKMRLLEEFEQTTESVAFSPDGNRIVAGVNGNALMVWSASRIDSKAMTSAP